MVMVRFTPQLAINPATGLPRSDLQGVAGQIVLPGTTTLVPIYEDAAKTIVIPSSSLSVTSNAFVQQFWTDSQFEVDWWDGTNRVPLESNQGARAAAEASEAAAELAATNAAAEVDVLLADAIAAADAATAAANAASLGSGAVPVGGTTGQVLVKNSEQDRDTKWADAATGTGGSGITWLTLPGKPNTFPADPHSHVAADITDASTLGKNTLRATDPATFRSLIGAGTSNQSLTIGTTAGTVAAGDHVHTQYQTAAQVDTKIAAAGTGGGVGNTVTIFGATAPRVNPRDGSTLPPYASVQWVASSPPVNFVDGQDTWLNI